MYVNSSLSILFFFTFFCFFASLFVLHAKENKEHKRKFIRALLGSARARTPNMFPCVATDNKTGKHHDPPPPSSLVSYFSSLITHHSPINTHHPSLSFFLRTTLPLPPLLFSCMKQEVANGIFWSRQESIPISIWWSKFWTRPPRVHSCVPSFEPSRTVTGMIERG